MDFIKWYKNKVDQSNLEPAENVWENIQDELDIDQSWHFINNQLTKESFYRRSRVVAIAASFLILFSIGSYWFIKPIQTIEFEQLVQNVIVAEDQLTNVNANSAENSHSKMTASPKEKDKILKESKNENIHIEKDDSYLSFLEINENYIEIDALSPLSRKDFLFSIETNKNIDQLNLKEGNESNKVQERKAFRKLYLGSTGQLANTWLLNEKTQNGFESTNLTSSNASFGSNWGLYIGSNLTKNIDLQFDFSILAQNNQDYNEYINGHYVSNTMRFNYSQGGISIRYKLISNELMKGEHGINAGAYLGYLHNAYQIIDGESLKLTDNYSHFDYGLFLGYEYIVPLNKKLGFGTGIRAYYGLKNIYSGNGNIPSYMNETKNASINISFSLKYSIK